MQFYQRGFSTPSPTISFSYRNGQNFLISIKDPSYNHFTKCPLRSSKPSSTKQQRVHTISSVEPTDAWDTYDTFIYQNDNSIIFDPDNESIGHISMIRFSIMSNTSPTGKFSALIDGGAKISVIKDS